MCKNDWGTDPGGTMYERPDFEGSSRCLYVPCLNSTAHQVINTWDVSAAVWKQNTYGAATHCVLAQLVMLCHNVPCVDSTNTSSRKPASRQAWDYLLMLVLLCLETLWPGFHSRMPDILRSAKFLVWLRRIVASKFPQKKVLNAFPFESHSPRARTIACGNASTNHIRFPASSAQHSIE